MFFLSEYNFIFSLRISVTSVFIHWIARKNIFHLPLFNFYVRLHTTIPISVCFFHISYLRHCVARDFTFKLLSNKFPHLTNEIPPRSLTCLFYCMLSLRCVLLVTLIQQIFHLYCLLHSILLYFNFISLLLCLLYFIISTLVILTDFKILFNFF